MCSIIGISCPSVTAEDILLFQRILNEGRIRGLHATGISWREGEVIKTLIEPVGADRFLEKHSLADCVDADGSLTMIAHTRYSTSDLRYNQPICPNPYFMSIVHNGVISQELPENWPKLYGEIGLCDTSNDSELLYRTVAAAQSPLVVWAQSSIAAIELYAGGKLRAYRNGRRPLWLMPHAQGYIFVSTQDMLRRAGCRVMPHALEPNTYYTVHTGLDDIPGILDYEIAYVQGQKDLQL